MSEVFGSAYAAAYDRLYCEKDYAAECDFIELAFKRHRAAPVRTILDLGCGTGNHAIPLAERGYAVTGVDRSLEMLQAGRAKLGSRRCELIFQQGDVRSLNLGQTFDAVLMMFAVLGYQPENADVIAALRTARRHLSPGGLLLLDVWYGPAVLAQRPQERKRVIQTSEGTILRTAAGQLDVRRHLCAVSIRLQQLRDEELTGETQEEHLMRFFFPREVELFLEVAGFRLRCLSSFPSLDEEPDENTWNVFVVAEAVNDVEQAPGKALA